MVRDSPPGRPSMFRIWGVLRQRHPATSAATTYRRSSWKPHPHQPDLPTPTRRRWTQRGKFNPPAQRNTPWLPLAAGRHEGRYPACAQRRHPRPLPGLRRPLSQQASIGSSATPAAADVWNIRTGSDLREVGVVTLRQRHWKPLSTRPVIGCGRRFHPLASPERSKERFPAGAAFD